MYTTQSRLKSNYASLTLDLSMTMDFVHSIAHDHINYNAVAMLLYRLSTEYHQLASVRRCRKYYVRC